MYSPAEDSYFLSEILIKQIKDLRRKINLTFLDMGCGSAIQAETALKAGIKKDKILCVDINPEAINRVKSLGFKAVKSNLFQNIKSKFNVISFNPPYLPEHKYDKKRDTSGGKKGDETIITFLKQAKSHLSKNGKIFLLFSSHTPKEKIEKEIKKNKYKIKNIHEKKLFMEKLYVYVLE
jgi:HemK-related putative methylase